MAAAESTAAKTVTAATVSPVGVAAVDSRALETARGIFKGREQRIAGVDHQMSGAVYHPDTRRINVQSGKYLGRLAEESSDPVVVRQAMHEGGTFLHETIHGTGTGFATRAEWKFYGTREGRVLEEGLTESLARRTLPEFMGSMFPTLDEAVLTARRLGSYDDYVSAIDSVADYVATFGQRTATGFVEELANGTVPMRRIDRMAEIILADAKLPADLKGPLSDLITQEVTRVGKAYRDAPPRDIGAAVRQAVEATRRELEAKP